MGADREAASGAQSLEETWGENVDLSTMCPNAEPPRRAWLSAAAVSLSPPAARDLDPHELEGGRPRRAAERAVPDPRPPPRGDRDARTEEGRYIAERIPGAEFVELAGDDHVPAVRPDEILDEIEEFLTGVRPAPSSETACSRPCSSPTSSARPEKAEAWATRRGAGAPRAPP